VERNYNSNKCNGRKEQIFYHLGTIEEFYRAYSNFNLEDKVISYRGIMYRRKTMLKWMLMWGT